MPIDYEFDSVNCSLTVYCENYESSVRLIIQLRNEITRFNTSMAKIIRRCIHNTLDNEYDLEMDELQTSVIEGPPTQVDVILERGDDLREIGKCIGRGLQNADSEIGADDRIDNGTFNTGLATVVFDE